MAERWRIVVSGRVQGVGFRWFVRESAESLSLAGWVRNNPDGTVELEAEGSRQALESLEGLLRKGLSYARVDSLDKTEVEPEGGRTFDIT